MQRSKGQQVTTAGNSQFDSLRDDGYVHLPGVVPERLVRTARRAINSSLAAEGLHPDFLPVYRAQSYCPELRRSRPVLDLVEESELWPLLRSLIAQGDVQLPSSAQIRLEFPLHDGSSATEPTPSLDGIIPSSAAFPEGRVENYTALLAVFLSDVPGPDAGNLTVWPGTHRAYEEYFRAHGPETLLDGVPRIDLPEPEQISVKAGDAVLVHYQTARSTSVNLSPHIAYAAHFRIRTARHESLAWENTAHWEPMTNIWQEWNRSAVAVS